MAFSDKRDRESQDLELRKSEIPDSGESSTSFLSKEEKSKNKLNAKPSKIILAVKVGIFKIYM